MVSGRMFLFNRKTSILAFNNRVDLPLGSHESKPFELPNRIYLTRLSYFNIVCLLMEDLSHEDLLKMNLNPFLLKLRDYMMSDFFEANCFHQRLSWFQSLTTLNGFETQTPTSTFGVSSCGDITT